MAECPTTVIMISSITTEGAQATIKALELGAVDFIPKELSYVSVSISNIKEDLISKSKRVCAPKVFERRLRRIRDSMPSAPPPKRLTSVIKKFPGLVIKLWQ